MILEVVEFRVWFRENIKCRKRTLHEKKMHLSYIYMIYEHEDEKETEEKWNENLMDYLSIIKDEAQRINTRVDRMSTNETRINGHFKKIYEITDAVNDNRKDSMDDQGNIETTMGDIEEKLTGVDKLNSKIDEMMMQIVKNGESVTKMSEVGMRVRKLEQKMDVVANAITNLHSKKKI